MLYVLFFLLFFSNLFKNGFAENTDTYKNEDANITNSNDTDLPVSEFDWLIKKFPNLYNRNADNNTIEDINAIISSPKSPKEADRVVTGPTYSYARPSGLYYTGSKAETMGFAYITNNNNVCVDNIVVQQMTYLIDELKVLLPYRSVAFVNCKNPNDLPKISLPTGKININIYDKSYPAKIINANRLTPGLEFYVNGNKVRVEYEYESVNIISSSDLFLNIRNKQQSFKYGQFSFRQPRYQEMFTTYALSIPFSQNILLQLSPLPSFLDLEKVPTEEDRSLPGTFATMEYCGRRHCNGGQYEGVSGTPYSFQREDYIDSTYVKINKLMTKANWESRLIHRSIVNQKSQFPNHVQETGLFKIEATCFVSATQEAYDRYIQNELPHELGHTYSLPDYSGNNNPNEKLMHFSLTRNLKLAVPFNKNYRNDRGSMNGGDGIGVLDHYTRLNRYSTLQVHRNVKNDNNTFPNEFFNLLNTDERSLMFVVQGNDLMGFVQNAYSKTDPILDRPPSSAYVTFKLYKDSTLLDTKYVAIPETRISVPYEWISKPGASLVTNYFYNKKRFYLPNDVAKTPRPFIAIKPDLFETVKEDDDGGNTGDDDKCYKSTFDSVMLHGFNTLNITQQNILRIFYNDELNMEAANKTIYYQLGLEDLELIVLDYGKRHNKLAAKCDDRTEENLQEINYELLIQNIASIVKMYYNTLELDATDITKIKEYFTKKRMNDLINDYSEFSSPKENKNTCRDCFCK